MLKVDSFALLLAAANAEAANNSDHEQEHTKLVSLPPGRLEIPDREHVSVMQIACGLQHTGGY